METLKGADKPLAKMQATLNRQGFATPVEAAQFLNLSKAMIHKLIGEGKMPACRYGRAVRIPWNWLCSQEATEN